MNIRIVREEIRQIFEAMNEQMEIIQQHKEKIPQIEIDLFMSNVRDLYEACISLNRLNMNHNKSAEPSKEASAPIPIEDIPIKESILFMAQVEESPDPAEQPREEIQEGTEKPEVETNPVDEYVDEYEIEAEPDADAILKPEPMPESDPEPEPEYEPIVMISPKPEPFAEMPAVSVVEPTPNPITSPSNDLFSTGTTIADKLKEEKITFNQRLQAEKQKVNVGAQLHHNQIRDLKSSIGINEKFQFINDLFRGNMQDYTLAITQLNQFNNFEEALEYIDILKFKYTWDINSDAHHKLMDFVRRRYV